MNKDKITISYILVTIVAFALILVYYANLDFHSMNDNIEKSGKKVLNRGKHYSDKLFTMVSSEWEELNKDEDVKQVKDPLVKKKDSKLKKAKPIFSTKGKMKKENLKIKLAQPVKLKRKIDPVKTKKLHLVKDSNKSEGNGTKHKTITLNTTKENK